MTQIDPLTGLPKELGIGDSITKESQKITIRIVKRRFGKLTTLVEGFEKDVSKSLKDQLKVSLIPKKFATPSNFNIWEDTIILQTFGETPAIIEIRNKHLVQGYLNYFNLLWDFGKKINKNLY